MSKKHLDFLIIPEGSSKNINFRLSLWKAWAILGLLGFWIVLLIVLTLLYGKAISDIVSGKSLRQENERLKKYNAKVVELEKELQEYRKFTQRVVELAGVEYPHTRGAQNSETDLAFSEEEADFLEQEENPLASKEEEEAQTPPKELHLQEEGEVSSQPDSFRQIPKGPPIDGWITRGFSVKGDVFGGEHPGIDFAAKEGTEVRVTADGTISFAGWDEVYGNLVAVDHHNGYVTYYGHNSKILVNSGDFVKRGKVIALSGNSGRSSAPHLHYEIKKDNIPIDPKDFLNPK